MMALDNKDAGYSITLHECAEDEERSLTAQIHQIYTRLSPANSNDARNNSRTHSWFRSCSWSGRCGWHTSSLKRQQANPNVFCHKHNGTKTKHEAITGEWRTQANTQIPSHTYQGIWKHGACVEQDIARLHALSSRCCQQETKAQSCSTEKRNNKQNEMILSSPLAGEGHPMKTFAEGRSQAPWAEQRAQRAEGLLQAAWQCRQLDQLGSQRNQQTEPRQQAEQELLQPGQSLLLQQQSPRNHFQLVL